MPTTAILELQFKPDAVEPSLELLRRILADTRAFDGCESVSVIQDHEDPAHVLVIEQWASREHDTAYRAWRAGEGAVAELPGLLAGAPRLSICERLADL